MHRHMSGTFVHHLHAVFPRALGQLALHLEFPELRFVIRIRNRSGRSPSPIEKLTS